MDFRKAADAAAKPLEGGALWFAAVVLAAANFFAILDMTIANVSVPSIAGGLAVSSSQGTWVITSYAVAEAITVPLTGWLAARFGAVRVFVSAMALFGAFSALCGIAHSLGFLVLARVLQGLAGGPLMPLSQTLLLRIFPKEKAAAANGLWAMTTLVAPVVGPILGGWICDNYSWSWIFFINVPVGIIGFVLAVRLVPVLPTHSHSFDLVGVALSAAGMFLLVFGIQEGEKYDWGQIDGFLSVPLLIGAGVVVLGLFFWWQTRVRTEPLVPLSLFRDRNFAVANIGIALVSAAITAMALPFMFYAQGARGWSPIQAGLFMLPMAVVLMGLSPFVGRLVDTVHPRNITVVGFSTAAIAMAWTGLLIEVDTPPWQLLIPMALFGVSNACLWAPHGATATRNLPMSAAGAGAGVYNTTRQVAAALGSAAIASLIGARLSANGLEGGADSFQAAGTSMPAQIQEPFAQAMSEAYWLPVACFALGVVVVLFFRAPNHDREPAVDTEVAAPTAD